ncbi:MAG: tryptophan synthase subunit alpha, partial [Caldilineaceae bacterium]
MTGVERIQATFAQARKDKRAAFMPYQAMGYPNRMDTLAIVTALAEEGADLFEIGLPHSDPLADGPTVQTATYTAITQGTTVADCLAMVRELRAAGVTTPFCAMSYYNPIFAYGLARFVDDAAAA